MMSHPLWELVHHKNDYCHFESGRCTSQKKHITGFEVLQATEGMCVLCSRYAFSFACLFVCFLNQTLYGILREVYQTLCFLFTWPDPLLVPRSHPHQNSMQQQCLRLSQRTSEENQRKRP